MTTQPLTPQNAHIVMLGPDTRTNHELARYGIPTDEGNVEPTLTVTRIRTTGELDAFLATNPSSALPWYATGWTFLGNGQLLYDRMYAYFGPQKTLAACLAMLNNEYAINPRLLRG